MFKRILLTFMLSFSLSSECSRSMKQSYDSLKILTMLSKNQSILAQQFIRCGWYPVTSSTGALIGYVIGSETVDGLPRLRNRPTLKKIVSHGIMWCFKITGALIIGALLAAHIHKSIDQQYANLYRYRY
jgi:hypothetical protein